MNHRILRIGTMSLFSLLITRKNVYFSTKHIDITAVAMIMFVKKIQMLKTGTCNSNRSMKYFTMKQ